MKQTTVMNTAAGALAALLLGSVGLVHANPYPVGSQQWHNHNAIMQSEADRIQRERNATRQQPINHGPSAAEVDAWQRREAQVQSRIARFRATPYWMALAWNFDNDGLIWPGGFKAEQRAIERAKQICTSPNCHVFATFNNTCAHFVSAVAKPRSVRDFFVADYSTNQPVRSRLSPP